MHTNNQNSANGADLIINAAPFHCMSGTLTASLFGRLSTRIGTPVLTVFCDGETDIAAVRVGAVLGYDQIAALDGFAFRVAGGQFKGAGRLLKCRYWFRRRFRLGGGRWLPCYLSRRWRCYWFGGGCCSLTARYHSQEHGRQGQRGYTPSERRDFEFHSFFLPFDRLKANL